MVTQKSASRLLSVVLGVLAMPLCAARAQSLYGVPQLRNTSYVGVGYVASIPDALVGFDVITLTPKLLGGAGLYADVKFTTTSPTRESYYDSTITVAQAENQFGDFLIDERSVWVTINVAAVYAVTKELALYGGAGYSREHHYREYYDDTRTRGLAGFYWIPDAGASGNRVNVLGGLLVRAGQYIVFQAGLGARPRGAEAGVPVMLPVARPGPR